MKDIRNKIKDFLFWVSKIKNQKKQDEKVLDISFISNKQQITNNPSLSKIY